MNTDPIAVNLQAGIAALKAGEKSRARELLMAVVTADERHEAGWLWLSGAVDTTADRLLCLENVLAINPDNQLARQGLAKLRAESAAAPETAVAPTTTVHTQRQPLSPASAILHPERYDVQSEERFIVTAPQQTVSYQTESGFDDVWSRAVDICAYCAQPVSFFDKKCPGCRRPLIHTQFRYPQPGASLHMYWVLLIGIGQLFLLKALFYILIERTMLPAFVNGILIAIFLGLAGGVYFRRVWAYYVSLFTLALLLLLTLVNFLSPVDLSALGVMQLDPAISNIAGSLIGGFAVFIDIFLVTAVIVGIILGTIRVGPDFEQTKIKLLANVGKGLQTAGDYSSAARLLADKHMWAAAILHWQRAAAKEPTHWAHQQALGQAYARLGYYQRALDALQSSRRLAANEAVQAELDKLITAVSEQAGLR